LIAGLNPLRIINDSTAVAFSYGITKSDLPELDQPSRNVVFVDVGHSSYTVSVVAFNKGQLVVKATAYDPHLGGRDIDYALVRHFANEFQTKYKIDVLSNPKATFRLAAQCERLKKILSANAEAALSVESIMNDVDASSKLSREEMEVLIADILSRVTKPLEEALHEAGLKKEDIHSIELVGGSSRVAAIRERIRAFFDGKTLSTTLNADEAVARGATFSCAQQSPAFRLKDFSISDVAAYPVRVQWERAPGDLETDDTELLVFPRGNVLPSTKVLTFSRQSTFDLEASYADPSVLPGKIAPWIGRITVKDPSPNGEFVTVKVKLRMNANGVFSFEDAYAQEDAGEDQAAEEGEATKRKVVKRKLNFVATNLATEASVITNLREIENGMHSSDKLVMDTEVRAVSSGMYKLPCP
jgi:heat shock protein 4